MNTIFYFISILLLFQTITAIPPEEFTMELVGQHLKRIVGAHQVLYEKELESILYMAIAVLSSQFQNEICFILQQYYTQKRDQTWGYLDLAVQCIQDGIILELKLDGGTVDQAYEQARTYTLNGKALSYIGFACYTNGGYLQKCDIKFDWDGQSHERFYDIFQYIDFIRPYQQMINAALAPQPYPVPNQVNQGEL